MNINGITSLEESQINEDSFNQLRKLLYRDYEDEPKKKVVLYKIWQKINEYENKLQEKEDKLKQLKNACTELSLMSRVNKLCEAVQKLDDAKETLRDRLIYGAIGVAVGGLVAGYFISK
ncbi:MAG: hypothetical protein ACTSR2_08885 [Candidatus Hodarchaeales archaeon]